MHSHREAEPLTEIMAHGDRFAPADLVESIPFALAADSGMICKTSQCSTIFPASSIGSRGISQVFAIPGAGTLVADHSRT